MHAFFARFLNARIASILGRVPSVSFRRLLWDVIDHASEPETLWAAANMDGAFPPATIKEAMSRKLPTHKLGSDDPWVACEFRGTEEQAYEHVHHFCRDDYYSGYMVGEYILMAASRGGYNCLAVRLI